MILNLFPKPLKPCAVSSTALPLFPVTEHTFSIVFRMISNLPSLIQQEIEFIRPMVEERFAKMEEYGGDWDDKPVCHTIVSAPLIRRLVLRTICSCG
jgi:hypothetical protein